MLQIKSDETDKKFLENDVKIQNITNEIDVLQIKSDETDSRKDSTGNLKNFTNIVSEESSEWIDSEKNSEWIDSEKKSG